MHVNEVAGDAEAAAHLLGLDSIKGRWDVPIRSVDDAIIVDGNQLSHTSNRRLAKFISIGIDGIVNRDDLGRGHAL